MLSQLYRLTRYAFIHPLTKRAPLQAAARMARWQLGSRLLGAPVVVPFAAGTTLVMERGMHGATGNLYYGLYEVDDMAFVAHALRDEDLFVDVGANIGSYTVLAAGVAGARTLACEPIPSTRTRLLRNVAVNHLEALVQVAAVAVSDREGIVTMTSDRDTTNLVAADGDLVVRATSLDTLLAGDVPAVMKIDVEGHEAAVLRGARQTLADERLLALVVELSGPEEPAVRELLAKESFVAQRYDPFARTLTTSDESNGHNFLFVRRRALAEVTERCRAAKPIDLGWTRV